MELTISGEVTGISVEGPVTVELPAYMQALPAGEAAEACASKDSATLIVAAGRHPNGNVVFVTGDGAIRSLDHVALALPPGEAFPADHGLTLSIAVTGLNHCYDIDSLYAVGHATVLLGARVVEQSGGRACVRYLDE